MRSMVYGILISALIGFNALASSPQDSQGVSAENKPHVKYRTGKDVNFDELLIQGQLQRPNISVVTGDSEQGSDGLLRLRENFLDQIASDTGESIQ